MACVNAPRFPPCMQVNDMDFDVCISSLARDIGSIVPSRRVSRHAAELAACALQLVEDSLGATEAALFKSWCLEEWAPMLSDFVAATFPLAALSR